jgi:hypothetical protein
MGSLQLHPTVTVSMGHCLIDTFKYCPANKLQIPAYRYSILYTTYTTNVHIYRMDVEQSSKLRKKDKKGGEALIRASESRTRTQVKVIRGEGGHQKTSRNTGLRKEQVERTRGKKKRKQKDEEEDNRKREEEIGTDNRRTEQEERSGRANRRR